MLACGALPAALSWLLDASIVVIGTTALGGSLGSCLWNMFIGHRVRSVIAQPVQRVMMAIEQLRSTGHAPRIEEAGAPLLRPMLRRFNMASSALEQRVQQSQANLVSVEAAFDRIHAVLQSLREGVAVVDPEGHVVLANRSAERLLDSSDKLDGQLLTEQIDGDLGAALLNGLAEVDGGAADFRASDLHHGSHILDLRVVQVQSNRPQQDYGKVIVLVDVTRNHEINRLRDELLSSISHELRTPLTNMCSSSEILASLTPNDEAEWREFAAMLSSESHRLKSLVDDVMEYSSIEVRQGWRIERANVVKSAHTAIEVLRQAAEAKQIALRLVGSDSAIADIDTQRLNEVLCRVLDNAIKFTPDHGQVQVRVTGHDGKIEIAVDDSGIGIPENERGKVFERFSQIGDVMTAKPAGTGLGMSITQRIVEAMGGKVWCEDSDLGGARFCISLPMAQPTRQ